ncbi:hypothetical protein [Flaviaesturariibacter terrae]
MKAKIKDLESGTTLDAMIEPASAGDFQQVRKNKAEFPHFKWSNYKSEEVYRVTLVNSKEVLAMMCNKDHAEEATNAIEIVLLEVANSHVGTKKRYGNIAGCLIAFACRESIKRGRGGLMFLIPKTDLVKHYQSIYGLQYERNARSYTGMMVAYLNDSRRLIQTYLE